MMHFSKRIRRISVCLACTLIICLCTGTVAQATVYEMYELVEGIPSESGYIPTYDPVEELTGETIISEDMMPAQEETSFGDGEVYSGDSYETQEGGFGDGTPGENQSLFEDGVSETESDENTAVFFSEETEEPENLNSEGDN